MKLRLKFSKRGKIRFTGHRDVARLFERAIRIVGLPVAYTEGFSPRQKVSFGLALPTCYESDAEYLDLFLAEDSIVGGPIGDDADLGKISCTGQGAGRELAIDEVAEAMTNALPDGLAVETVALVERGGPSLQEAIVACTWHFSILGFDGDPEAAVADLLALDELVVERMKKGKPVSEDVRGAISSLSVHAHDSDYGPVFEATLSSSPRVVRPAELLPALAEGHELAIARRIHQWTEQEGAQREPLAAPAPAPHAVRAS